MLHFFPHKKKSSSTFCSSKNPQVTTRDKKAHTHTTQQKTQVGRIAM
jgi:hypothetical protein